MNKFILGIRILGFLALVPDFAYGQSIPAHGKRGSTEDNYCGPRCVQYILYHYGVGSVSLPSLVKRLDFQDNPSGVSLTAVKKLLESYGVETKPIRIPADHVLRSPNYCIVHLQNDSSSGPGHFVVLLPGTSRQSVLFWDFDGVKRMSSWEFADKSTGTALVALRPNGLGGDVQMTVEMTVDAIVLRLCILSLVFLAILIGYNVIAEASAKKEGPSGPAGVVNGLKGKWNWPWNRRNPLGLPDVAADGTALAGQPRSRSQV
jgi:hypothetical protein